MIEDKLRGHLGVGNSGGNLWADWLKGRILLREADAILQAQAASRNAKTNNKSNSPSK